MNREQDTKTRPLNLRVQQPLYDWLEAEAKVEGMTVSELVRYLLLIAKKGSGTS